LDTEEADERMVKADKKRIMLSKCLHPTGAFPANVISYLI